MARYDAKKLATLMNDAGIVRNRAKIEASVTQRASLSRDRGEAAVSPTICGTSSTASRCRTGSGRSAQVPAATPLAEKMSKDLKRGFHFCGPTIVYAFMQACGLVNDHLIGCHRHDAVAALARPR